MAESQDKSVTPRPGVETHAKENLKENTDDLSNENTPVDPPSDVVELCRETFQKTAEYLQGELDGTIEDYKLLEKLNQVTMGKYSDMKHIALSISGALKDLNEKYTSLQPYLEQIEQIDDSLAALEQAAYSLDQYSKRLEAKFKALEKR